MARMQKIEAQVEIMSQADMFFTFWVHNPHHVTKVCPDKYSKVELLQGDWHTIGSIQIWHFIAGDKHGFIKKQVEDMNQETRSITYSLLDSDILGTDYEIYKPKLEVKLGSQKSVVNWSIEYKKLNEDAPEPNMALNFLISCVKDIDAHLFFGENIDAHLCRGE